MSMHSNFKFLNDGKSQGGDQSLTKCVPDWSNISILDLFVIFVFVSNDFFTTDAIIIIFSDGRTIVLMFRIGSVAFFPV